MKNIEKKSMYRNEITMLSFRIDENRRKINTLAVDQRTFKKAKKFFYRELEKLDSPFPEGCCWNDCRIPEGDRNCQECKEMQELKEFI